MSGQMVAAAPSCRMVRSNHVAADAARVAYNFPKSVREERVTFYLEEAAGYEEIADQLIGDTK